MDLEPASLAQVRTGRDGRRVLVEDDVLDIAGKLKAVDADLRLQWNEKGEFFAVVQITEDGGERLVTTAQECDDRLVERMAKVTSSTYDLVADMDQTDAAAERAKDHAFSEQTGEIAERLASAVRKDLNPAKIIVPKDL